MEIEEILKKLPKAPADVTDWIYKYCAYNGYIIYKNGRGICTRCGKEFDILSVKHNEVTECPHCGHMAICKAARYGRKSLIDEFRVMVYVHRGKTIYATLWQIQLDYSPAGKPEIGKDLVAVYTFNKKEQSYYRKYYDWCAGKYDWEKAERFSIPGSGRWVYKDIYIYRGNLERVFETTDMKYLKDKSFTDTLSAYQLLMYIRYGLKYESIEKLKKVGFERIVRNKLSDWPGSGAIYWRGKTLQKILRLDMDDIRKAAEHNPGFAELAAFQALTRSERKKESWETVESVSRLSPSEYKKIGRYTNVLKYVKYREKTKGVYSYAWLDYIEAAQKIGLDITKKDVLFPKDFRAAHDEALDTVKIAQSKERDKKIKNAVPRIEFHKNGLLIKAATSQKSLNGESRQLDHCVRTYGDRLADGKCYIYFIRQESEPKKSYYTLETNAKGEFVQCRGMRNCEMTEEVKAFVKEFCKHLQKQLKKKVRKAA